MKDCRKCLVKIRATPKIRKIRDFLYTDWLQISG